MLKQSDFFRHVDKLTIHPIPGQISGNIPKWLEGVMIRNGPGIQEIGPDHYKHFYDGLAVLHRFEIKNGEVYYQNRNLESDNYKKNMKAQRIIVTEFGTTGVPDPCKSLFQRFQSKFFPGFIEKTRIDNCNVNIGFYGDQLYAMTETVCVRRIDPTTLETIGSKTCIDDYLTINQATAHPHILEDGTIINMGNNYRHLKGPHYCIIQVPPSYESDETCFKEAKIIAEIPCRWKLYPCYYHSFGMTSNKIVFIEQPYCISIPKILSMDIFSRSFLDCLFWHPNHKTRIYIVSRETGKPETLIYETDELFTFHHINAYEEDGNIIMDVCGYKNAYFVDDIVIDSINTLSSSILTGASARRYVLPTKVSNGTVTGEDLINIKDCEAKATLRTGSGGNIIDCKPHQFTDWFELPRINYKYNGKKYNFFYGIQSSIQEQDVPGFPDPDTISKFDIKNSKLSKWTGKEILVSEPIFVPNPTLENPEEDDGIILSALLHKENSKLVTLLILNAKDMSELAQVKFVAEGPVSSTFHGQWAHTGNKVHLY